MYYETEKTFKRGICGATIYTGPTDDTFQKVELTYEAEEHEEGGYDVYVNRPEVSDASDLMLDVTTALAEDGLHDITRITWL